MGIITQGLSIAILGIFVIVPVFAEESWIIVETDKTEYSTGQSLVVTGLVLERKMPVIAMSVYDPDGIILSANSVELQEDNSFSKTISLDSPFYDKSGIYLIDFDYGKKTEQMTFEIESTQEQQEPILPEIIPEVIFVETDKGSYHDNEFITISGMVSILNDPTILVGIYDPNGMPAGFYTPTVGSNLEFVVSFLAKEGVNFKTFGHYTVKAHYGESKSEASFEFAETPVPPTNTSQPTKPDDPTKKPIPEKPTTDIVDIPKPQDSKPDTEIVEPPSNPQKPEIVSEQKQEEQVVIDEIEPDNLSVEDVELGKMLNEIKLKCDSSRYMDSIIYYDGMGPALMRLCNYEQAISHFDHSLIDEPHNIEIITNKGVAFSKLGQLDVAIDHYNMALEMNPTYLPALNNKANVLAERGQFEEAIRIYNSVLKQDPSYIISKTNLQKLQEKIAEQMLVKQETEFPQDDTSIPIVEGPVEVETAKIETVQIESPNIIEHIGSIFVSFFGLLR